MGNTHLATQTQNTTRVLINMCLRWQHLHVCVLGRPMATLLSINLGSFIRHRHIKITRLETLHNDCNINRLRSIIRKRILVNKHKLVMVATHIYTVGETTITTFMYSLIGLGIIIASCLTVEGIDKILKWRKQRC